MYSVIDPGLSGTVPCISLAIYLCLFIHVLGRSHAGANFQILCGEKYLDEKCYSGARLGTLERHNQ